MKIELKSPDFRLKIIQSYPLNSIWFEFRDLDPLSVDQMQAWQEKAGYLIAGYGFYNPRVLQLEDGSWQSTWSCSNSAD